MCKCIYVIYTQEWEKVGLHNTTKHTTIYNNIRINSALRTHNRKLAYTHRVCIQHIHLVYVFFIYIKTLEVQSFERLDEEVQVSKKNSYLVLEQGLENKASYSLQL